MDKDLETRRCLSDDERYADLINGLLCDGEQKVQASDLLEWDSQSFLRMWSKKKPRRYRRLYRDLIKKTAFGVNFALIGIENQELEEDAYDMIAACTRAEELTAVKKYCGKDGKIDMCQAIKEMLADERQLGMEAGMEKGREEGREQTLLLIVSKKVKKNMTLDMIADDLEEDVDVIRPIYERAKGGR